jgi:hypothetical protein
VLLQTIDSGVLLPFSNSVSLSTTLQATKLTGNKRTPAVEGTFTAATVENSNFKEEVLGGGGGGKISLARRNLKFFY